MQTSSPENQLTFRKVFTSFLYVFLLGFALVLGTFAGWANKSPVVRDTLIQEITGAEAKDAFAGTDSLSVLVLGVDNVVSVNRWGAKVKTIEGGRSDMMLVARLDFENNRIGAVSIPRDTLHRMRPYRKQKINAYHAIGGADLSADAVESMLPGVTIDRTVVLNFDAFVDIVDILGGVDIYVPKDMKWDDDWGDLHIDLKKGRQHLDGYEAMGFARFRHTDSDYERQKRQKDLMVALKQKMMTNVFQAGNVADKSLELFGNAFESNEMASLIRFVKSVETHNITMGQVPVVEVPDTYDLELDRRNVEDVLAEFRVVSGEVTYARFE